MMKLLRSKNQPLGLFMIVLMLTWQIGQPLQAATFYWDTNGSTAGAGGTTPSGSWDGINAFFNTDATGGGAGALSASTTILDTLTFAAGTGATGSYNVLVSGTQNIGGLTFEEGIVNLAGGTLNLGTSPATIQVGTGLTALVSSVLSGSGGLNITGGGRLYLTAANTFTGNVSIDASTLAMNFAYNSDVANPLGAAGARNFTLTNSGTLQILGNTYNPAATTQKSFIIGTGGGTFNITAGQLQLDDASQFSGTGDLTVTSGGNGVFLVGGAAGAYTGFSGNVIINGGTTRVTNVSGLGNTANRAITVNSGGSLDVSIAAFAPGTNTVINLNGNGLNNTGALQTTTANGTTANNITLSSNASIGNTSTFTLGLTGVISGGFSLTKVGAGTGALTLSGLNTYTGNTIVNAGVLIADSATNAAPINSASGLVFSGSGTFRYTGLAATTRAMTLNGLTLAGGAGILDVNNTGTSTTLTLGTLTRNTGGGSVDFRATTGTVGTTSLANISSASNINGILGGFATVNSGANLAALDVSKNVVAFSAYTDINTNGSVIASNAATNVRIQTVSGSGNITLGAATTDINTLFQNTATAVTVDPATNILRLGSQGGIITSSTASTTGTVTIGTAANSGTLTAGGADNTAGEIIVNTVTANTVTINSVIADNGTGVVSLNMTGLGAGTLSLGGTNTYTGSTTITNGTVQINAPLGNVNTAGALGKGSVAGSAADLVINGGTLQLSQNAPATTDRLFSVGLGNATITNNNGTAANTLSFTGTGALGFNGQSGSRTLTLTGTNTGTNLLASVLGDNGAPTHLTKSAAGTWILTGNNTYTGTTTVSAGELRVGNGGTTGSLGTGYIAGTGGTISFNRSDNVTLNNLISGGTIIQRTATTLSLNNAASSVLTLSFSGVDGGIIDLLADVATNNAGSTGILATNSGTINATGGGRIIINSTSTATNGQDWGAAAAKTLTINAVIANGTANNVDFFATAGGTVILTADNTFTGNANISNQIVQVSKISNAGQAGNLGAGTNVIFTGAGTLRYVGTGETTNRQIELTNAAAGTSTIDQSGTGLLRFTGTNTSSTAFAKTLSLTGSTTGTGEIAGTIVDNSTTNTTGIAKNGTGTWTLSGANTYTGTTVVNGGALILGNLLAAQNSVISSTVTNTTTAGLVFKSGLGGTFSVGGLAGLQNLALVDDTGAALTSLTIGGTNTTGGTYSGVLSGSTPITKTGPSTQTFTGVNTYTGKITITGGILAINNELALGPNPASSTADQLTLNGGSIGAAANTSFTIDDANRGITIGASGGSFDAAAAASMIIARPIAGGSNTVTKSGTGVVIFTAANTYGATNITGGRLVLSGAGTLGSGTVTLSGGAALAGFSGTQALTIGATSGSLLYTQASGAGNDISSGLTLTSGGTLIVDVVNSAATVTFASAFGNSLAAGVSKVGAGTLTLAPATSGNTFTGTTTVGAGTLALAFNGTSVPATNIIAPTSALSMRGGTLSLLGVSGATNSQTFASTALLEGGSTLTATQNSATSLGASLGAIARDGTTNRGTINFVLPTTGAYATTTLNNTSGILGGWATVGGTNWATVTTGNIASYALDTTDLPTTVGSTTVNYRVNAGTTLGGAVSANAIRFTTTGLTLALGSNNLTLTGGGTGGILLGLAAGTISGTGTVGAGAGNELLIYTNSGSTLTISAVLAGGAVTKSGAGTLTLGTSTNTFNGALTINGGTVSIDNAARVSSASGITLNGGTLTVSSNQTTDRALTVGLNGGTFTYSAGAGNGGWSGALSLISGGSRTITFNANNAGRFALFSGVFADAGGPTSIVVNASSDTGLLQFSGANSTYTGATTLNRGILRINAANGLSPGSNVTFNGGANRAILEFNTVGGTSFTRELGTQPGQVQWLGNGGFSAATAGTTFTVNLGGLAAPATVVWNSGSFVPTGSSLQFAQNGANQTYGSGTVDFRNPIDLSGTAPILSRDINVADNGSWLEAILSGAITNSGANSVAFSKSGSGVLRLNADNSASANVTLSIAAAGGYLILNNASAIPGASGANVTINAGGALVLAGSTNPLASIGSRIVSGSAGSIALDVNSSTNIDFTGFSTLALGAYNTTVGVPVIYTGTIMPAGTAYRIAPGGRNSNLAAALTGNAVVNFAVDAATQILVLPNANSIVDSGGARSLALGSGTTYLGSYNTYTGGTTVVGSNGSATVGIGSDAAFGSGLVTFNAGTANGFFGALNGDRVLNNNVSVTTTGNWVASGDAASDGITNAGSMTYNGTVAFVAAQSVFGRTRTPIFLGNITAGGTITLNNTVAIYATSNFGGITKTHTAATLLNDNSTLIFDSNAALGSGSATTLTMGSATGSSTLRLAPGSGSVTLTGRTVAMRLGDHNPIINVWSGDTLTMPGNVTGNAPAGARTTTKNGAGTWVLSGAANTLGGSATLANTMTFAINGGTVVLDASALAAAGSILPVQNANAMPLILGNSTNATFSNGGTLRLLGNTTAGRNVTQTFAGMTLRAKDNAIALVPQSSSTVGLTLTSITPELGSLLALTTPANSSLSITTGGAGTANTILLDNSNAYAVIGTSAGSITDWAARDAATTNFNIITGTAAGIYTANTGTTLAANADLSATGSATVTLSGVVTTTSLRFNEGTTPFIINTGTSLATGGILVGSGTAALNQTIQGTGTLLGTSGTNKQLLIYQGNTGGNGTTTGLLTISAPIADNGGASALVKSGPGTLVLSGNNTFTGSIYLNSGVLSIATTSLGSSANPLGQMTAGTTNLLFNGGSLRYTGAGSVTTDRGFQFNASGNVEITQSGGTLAVNQVMTGISGVPGIMTKTGLGALSLSGTSANVNLGVTVAAGTLNLDKSGVNAVAAGSGFTALIVANSATAKITGGGGDQIADGSGVVVIGTGTLDLNGNSEAIDSLAGTGVITNTGSNGAPITLTLGTTTNNTSNIAAYTLAADLAELAGGTGVRATGLASFGGTISDNGSNVVALSKGGAGTQTLSYTGGTSTYTYSGNTTITSGTLMLRAANLLPFGSGKGSVTLVGNTLINGITVPGILDMGGFNQSINGLTGAAGSIVTNTPLSSISASQTNTLTVGNNDVSSTFDGIFQDGYVIARPGGTPTGFFGFLALTKTGAGVLTLTGTNINTGATTINGGRIDLNNATGNALSNSITVNTNGTLRLLANNQINDLNSVTVAGGTFDINGRTETVGVVLADGSITDTAGGGVLSSASAFDLRKGAVSAVLGGSSGLAKTTSDTVTLSGINTYGGATTTAGSGSLVVSSTGAINNSSGITLGDTSKMFVNGSTALAVPLSVGSGTTLGGQGTVNGTVSVAAGGIIEAGQSSSGTLSVGTLNFGGVATLNLFNLDGTASILNVLTGMTTTSGLGNEVTINITNSGSLADSTGNGYKLIDVGSGFIFGATNNNFKLGTVTGVGGRTAKNLNYVNGDALYLTIVAANPIWSGAASSEWSTGPISGSKNWLVGGNPDDYIDLPNPDTVVFDDTATGTTTVDITVANVSPNGVSFNNSTLNYVLQGSKSIIGGTSLAKDGTGMLTINNANAFTGGVVITNGTIKLGNASALGTANAVTFGTGSVAKLQLFGNNATISGLTASATTPVVENGDAATSSILTVNLAAGTNTYAGILQDGAAATLGLTKQGGGTLILTGANMLTGGNIVSSGTLQIGNGGSTGTITGDTSLSSGTSLVFNRSGSYANSGGVSGAGALSVLGGGTLALNGDAAHTGGTTIATLTTLQVGNGGSTGALSGTGTITNNGILGFNRTGSSIVQGNISGTGALSVGNGTTLGTLILTGSNIYSGATTINANATLQLGNGGTSGTIGTGTITDNGTLAFNRTDSVTVGAAIGGIGSLRVMSGLVTLTGANTFSGGVQTDTGGTLTIGNGTTGSILGINGAAGGNVTNNGALVFNRTGSLTWDNQISGSGNVTTAAGNWTFTNSNGYSGSTSIAAGSTLTIGTGGTTGSIGNAAVNVAGGIVFNRSNGYSFTTGNLVTGAGSVTLGAGSYVAVVNNQFNTTGALILGTTNGSATATSLDLSTFNSAFGSLNVQTNTAAPNTINIGTGRTLTLAGGPAAVMTVGTNSAANALTNLTFTGGGSLSVTRPGGTIQIGGATGATNSSATNADLSALANFTADLGSAGVFRVGDTATTSATTVNTFTGAVNNTITVGQLAIGDGTGSGVGAKTFNLGSGTNILNVNTINIGEVSNINSARGSGALQFASGAFGTLTVRSVTGASGVTNLNLVNSASITGTQLVGNLLLNGRSVDLSFNAITMAARSAGTTLGADATLSFDTGTLTANTLSMVTRSGATFTTGASSGTVNIGGTTAGTTATFGTVNMSTNSVITAVSTSAGNTTALMTITGIGTTSITTLNMAANSLGAATSASTATATINIGASGTPTVSLGTVTMSNNTAAATSATNATSAINIAGGTVTASSIAMANTSIAANVATATLAITGGTLTLGGNITTQNGLGTENTTLTINGGILDMGGFSIGAVTAVSGATSIGTLNFQSGGLRNVLEINGGAVLTKTTAATFTLDGTNSYTGGTAIQLGKIVAVGGANNRLGSGGLTLGNSTSSGVLQLGTAAGASNQTVTSLATSGTGTTNAIVGGNVTASILTVNQSTTTTFLGNLGGAGANENTVGITKSGAGSLTISGTSNTYTGPTVVSAGILSFTGNGGAPVSTSALTVAAGATLNFNNTIGQAINLGSGALDLASGTGTTTLGLDLGSTSAYDSINTTGVATTGANPVTMNLVGIAGFGPGTYNLLTATGGGLSTASYSIGSVSGTLAGVTLSLLTDPTFVRLNAVASTGSFFWNGGVNTSWTGFSGLNSNFTDLLGTTNTNGTPGIASSVIFTSSTQTGTSLATTLDAVFSIRDLTFNNQVGTGPLASISITPGTGGTLTITPSADTSGINVQTGAPAAINISAPITLGANQTWTVADAATVFSSSGGIIGIGINLTKAGDGRLALLGTNTYSGTTTVNGGILAGGAASAFSASSAHVIGATGTLSVNGFAQTIGSLAGVAGAIVANGAASGNVALTVGGNNTSTTFAGTLQNGAAATLAITKVGTGTLTLSGTNTYTGSTLVNAGVLAIAGSTTMGAGSLTVGNSAAGSRARAQIGTGASLSVASFFAGSNATAAGAFIQTDGLTNATAADATNVGLTLGNAAGAYGYYKLSGGSLTSNRITIGGNGFANATGVFEQTGGTSNFNVWTVVSQTGGSNALLDVSGGTLNSAGSFALNHGSSSYAVVNVRGTGTINRTAGSISLMQGNTNSLNNVGIMNLLTGGTIRTHTGGIVNGAGTGSSGNLSLLNFNGGTIVTNAASTTLVNISTTAHTANSGAYLYSGGLTVDTNGLNSTINGALLSPTGAGVSTIALTSGGSGYIGAPLIKITGGTGVGATAVANMVDDGTGNGTFSIGSITITNSGTGYVNTDNLTLVFGDNTSVYTTQAVLGAVGFNTGNTSGGLVKAGSGTLTLSGPNTYTGGTTINLGTLALGASNVLADAGAVTINGGTFDAATFTDTVGTVTLQSGTIQGSSGVLTSSSDFVLQSGTVGFTGAGGLGGSVNVNKTTSATVTLSSNGLGSFANVVNVTAGTLAFSTATQLGNAAATNTLTVNGGTLSYTGAGAVSLAANQVVSLGASHGTLNATQSTGVITFAGGIAGASTGNLTKTGSGSVVISGSTNLNGGTVTVSDGKLTAGFGASGITALNVGTTGNMSFQNGAAEALALSGALNLSNGARLGFDLGALGGPGTSDQINSAVSAVVANSAVITLDFSSIAGFGVGTYNLISASGGLLGVDGFATYVLGSGISGFKLVPVFTNTLVSLNVTPFVPIYWRGGQNASWNTLGAATANWTTDAAGLTDAGSVPGTTHTVVFSATSAPFTTTSPNVIDTTLDAAFTIDSLQFIGNPTGITAIRIAAGTGGSLNLTPTSSVDGIEVQSNAGTVTISAPLTVGANQTWSSTGTNSALVISGPTTFNSNVSKIGAGALTLSGSNSGTGGFSLLGGTLNLAQSLSNSSNAFGSGTLVIGAGTTIDNTSTESTALANNNVQTWNGSFTFTGTRALNLGTGAVTLANNVTLTTTASSLTVGGVISQTGGNRLLTKAGAGALTLNGNNTWAGGLSLSAGTLNLGNAGALGTGIFTIGAGTTIDNTSGLTTLTNANSNAQAWNGSFTFTGSNALNLGTGTVTLGSSLTATVSASTLTVGGVISGAGFGLTKSGSGTLVLSGLSSTAASNFNGNLTLDGGTTNITGTASLTGGLVLGAANASTTNSTLNLAANSLTVGAATVVQTNSTTPNVITIGASQTLRLNGAVTVGAATGPTTTRLTVSGSGTLTIGAAGAATNANIQVGNSATDVQSNAATWDMSGLATFYANIGTGTFRLGDPTNATGTGTGASTVIFATNSTIFASTITSDSPASIVTQAFKLGSGVNEWNANTITIGGAANRATGTLDFNTTTGTIKIRALDGASAATMNVQNGAATTGANLIGTVNLTGHSVDLMLGTVAVGGRSAAVAASGTGSFSYDTGTVVATTFNVGFRTGTTSTTGNVTGTLTIGGGTSTIGTITLATNSVTGTASTTGSATGMLNISGGTNTITTLTMATNSQGPTAGSVSGDAISNVNISGGTNSIGTVTMGVNTVAAGFATGSDTNATMTISGGATTVTTAFTMGAQNSANNAATTVNSAISALNISAGSLILTGSTNLTMGSTTLDVNNAATSSISITGTGTLTVGGNITYAQFAGSTVTNSLTLNGGTLDMTSGTIGATATPITFNAQSGTLSNLLELNGGGATTAATLEKTTAGTLLLNTSNAYTGFTTVTAGVLQMTNGSALGGTARGTTVSGTGAALEISNNITINLEALTLNGTGVGNGGALRSTAGTNIYAGNITLNSASRINADAGSLTIDVPSGNAITSTDLGLTLGGAGNIVVADAIALGAGGLTKDGNGTVTLGATNTYTGTTTISAGTLQVGNGTDAGSIGTTSAVSNSGALVYNVGTGTRTLGAVISGTGTLTQNSAGGTLLLTGTNTFNGLTTVNAGTLGGTGAVGGDLTVASGGTLAPGIAGAGQFSISGNLTVNLGGILAMQIGGATANDSATIFDYFNSNGQSLVGLTIKPAYELQNPVVHDFFSVAGGSAPAINGTVKLTSLSYTPIYGDIFDLLDWSGLAGVMTSNPTFDLSSVTLGTGLSFNTQLFASNGIIVVVPEPSRALFLMFGLLGLMLHRRRRSAI